MARKRKEQEMSKGKPVQRNAANARERARMRVLSKAFCRLKTTLPWVPADTKLSKLDTLRLASSYIAHLRHILRMDGATDEEISVSTVPIIDDNNRLSNEEDGFSSSDGGDQGSFFKNRHRFEPSVHPMNLTWPFTFGNRQNQCSNDDFSNRKMIRADGCRETMKCYKEDILTQSTEFEDTSNYHVIDRDHQNKFQSYFYSVPIH